MHNSAVFDIAVKRKAKQQKTVQCSAVQCSADMEKNIFFSNPNKVWAKTILPEKVRNLQQKWIRDKTASNVFDNKYGQNKTATHQYKQQLCNNYKKSYFDSNI